jgi:hypothetical protein
MQSVFNNIILLYCTKNTEPNFTFLVFAHIWTFDKVRCYFFTKDKSLQQIIWLSTLEVYGMYRSKNTMV